MRLAGRAGQPAGSRSPVPSRPGACGLGFPLAELPAGCPGDPHSAVAARRGVAPCGPPPPRLIPGLSGAAGTINPSFLCPGTGRALFAAALPPPGLGGLETRRCSLLPKIHNLRDSRPFPKTLTTVDGAGAQVSLSYLAHPVPCQEAFILLPTRSSREEARALRPPARPARQPPPAQNLCPGTWAPLAGARMDGPEAPRPLGGKTAPGGAISSPTAPLRGAPQKNYPARPGPAPAATWGGLGIAGAHLCQVAVAAPVHCLLVAHFSLSTRSLVV